MFEKLRDSFRPVADFIAKYFAWLSPDVLTVFGLLLSFIPVYFFINGNPRLGGITMVVFLFDFLDGAVARYTNKVTLFGEVLDASFDRIVDAMTLFAIGIGGFVSWYLVGIVLIGSYMVSYVRARTGEAAGTKEVKLNVGIAQRGDRILLLILGSVFYFENISVPVLQRSVNTLEVAFVILAFLTWYTVIYRFIYAKKIFRELKKNNG